MGNFNAEKCLFPRVSGFQLIEYTQKNASFSYFSFNQNSQQVIHSFIDYVLNTYCVPGNVDKWTQ